MGCFQSVQIQPPTHLYSNNKEIFQRHDMKLDKVDLKKISQVYIQERVKQIFIQPDKQDKVMLHKVILSHNYLYRLLGHERNQLIECFDTYSCKAQTQIFKKGNNATLFFIVRNGTVQIKTSEGEKQKNTICKRGDTFGDLALLFTAPRSADAIALTDCQFFCISSELLRKTIREITKRNYEFAKKFIEKVIIFKYLTKRQKTLITYNSLILQFQKGELIFKSGDDANSFYIITHGKVSIEIQGKQTLQLLPGDSFGQNCFTENRYRSGTAFVMQKTSILSISRQSLKKCLNNQLEDISYYNILKWSLKRDTLFSGASSIQRQKLIVSTQIVRVTQNQVICEAGEKAEFLVIILEGSSNEEDVGKILNKQYLTANRENELKMENNIIQTKDGKIGKINFQVVFALFGKKIQKLTNRQSSRQAILQISNQREEYIKNLKLDEFLVKMKIGEGQHGNVHLVEDSRGKRYALKWMEKQKIIQSQLQKLIMNQKKILKMIDNPFIMKTYRTFQDQHCVYFLLNFIKGIDFFQLIRKIGLCSKKITQFYVACIILALQYLHELNIIHRDLKPENAIIDSNGYLYLINLGIAKILSEQTGYRTFTVIGTPHYMAPEIVELEGYSFSSDLWSLGVMIYEMMSGQLPYGNFLNDPYQIFKQIISKQLKFPKIYLDTSTKSLISKLLSKSPNQRFIEQFSRLKNMKFFQDFDWQELNRREMRAPLIPQLITKQININKKLKQFIKKQINNSIAKSSNLHFEGWDDTF